MAEEAVDKFQSAVYEIEDGIRIMRLATTPDQRQINWWTVELVKLKEQIAQEKAGQAS
jgi:hypothetical protein